MSDVKIKQLDPSQIRYTPEENEIIRALNDSRIFRSLCIQGGEPLAP